MSVGGSPHLGLREPDALAALVVSDAGEGLATVVGDELAEQGSGNDGLSLGSASQEHGNVLRAAGLPVLAAIGGLKHGRASIVAIHGVETVGGVRESH